MSILDIINSVWGEDLHGFLSLLIVPTGVVCKGVCKGLLQNITCDC